MSLLSKLVKAVAPIASVIPGPWQPIAQVVTAVGAAKAARSAVSSVPQLPGVMPQGILPGLPAIGAIGMGAMRMLPGIGAMGGVAVRGAIGAGRGLIGAASRWCQRNPKTCASLGGATIVADMMRSGEIKRPGRRMNPMNVRAMRRAIRRVKSGRKIAQQIERLLPHRKATGSQRHRRELIHVKD